MKKLYSFLTIIILIFSLSSMNGLENEENEINYEKIISQNSDILEKYNKNLNFIEGEYVIFAENNQEFDILSNMENTNKIYRNIKAIKIDLNYETYNELNKQFKEIYPSELFITKQFNQVYDQRMINKGSVIIDSAADVDKLNVKPLWDAGYNGTGVVVAVLDNGVDFTHPALATSKQAAFDISPDDSSPCKDHGTPVAGSVAARAVSGYEDAVGTAPGAKIFSIEAGCGEVDGQGVIYYDQLDAFEIIFENNATIDIVNTSLGSGARTNELFNRFVAQLDDLNITLVGSAGNNGEEGDRSIYAAYGNTVWGISVAASTYSDQKARFSSIGPGYGFNQKPDVIAPGQDVIAVQTLGASDGTGMVYIDGTSFSAPTTAGALATLLSALRAQGYNTNPGLLKAALMRGATPITNNINTEGFGLPNVQNSLNLIKNLELSDDNTPRIVELTPKVGPVGLIEYIPQNAITDVTYTMISSHPLETTFSFGGGLEGIASVDELTSDYSQYIKIKIDTNGIEENSVITGTFTAFNGNDNVTASLTINVGESFKGKIAFDRFHTFWDFTMGNVKDGTNTGEVINVAMKKGWQVDEINERITSELLENYDMLWMPDSLNAITNEDLYIDLEAGVFKIENFILQDEIDAIHEFVENGKDLMFVFNGVLGTDGAANVNATAVNKLLSKFDIKAVSEPLETPSNALYIPTKNKTSLVKGVTKLTHFGNYLEIEGNAIPYTMDSKGRISGAIYTSDAGGDVLVASSNFWMDNAGVRGEYSANVQGQMNDALLSNQMWDWFSRENKIIKQSDNFIDNKITGSFMLSSEGGTSSSEEPLVYLRPTLNIEKTFIEVSVNENGIYSFEYDVGERDGNYDVVVEYGGDYISFNEKFIDNTAPVVSFTDDYPNGTIYQESSSVIIEFIVEDVLDEITKSDVVLSIDGEELVDTRVSYNSKTGIFRALISLSVFGEISEGKAYYLEITVNDQSENFATYVYEFFIGERNTSESTSIITTENNSTIVETTEVESASHNFIWYIVTISFIGILPRLFRTKYT